VLERIVEHWLTRAGERSYEIAFAQLLLAEGWRILHGPVHHPYEHGKDIAAVDPDGRLCGIQLKDGDVSLADFEKYQGQLTALSRTAITYPGIEPPRLPDRVLFVTNGVLTPPARNRIEALNSANRGMQYPSVECVEREQLVGRFAGAQSKFLPQELRDVSSWLLLALGDGNARFPVQKFGRLLEDVLSETAQKPLDTERALASAVLVTAQSVDAWQRTSNHLAVAEAWLRLAAAILHTSERTSLDAPRWKPSFDMTLRMARESLSSLFDEATTGQDLLVPDPVDGIIYPARALLVCGYSAAWYLSSVIDNSVTPDTSDRLRRLLLRELPFVKLIGESQFPHMAAVCWALENLGERDRANQLIGSWLVGLAKANQPEASSAVADPYHPVEELLRRAIGAEIDEPDETFDGHAYTAHVALDWLARRGIRAPVAAAWRNLTKVTLCEFDVATPRGYLTDVDDAGTLRMWHLPLTGSWRQLTDASRVAVAPELLPKTLVAVPQFLPFVTLLFPQRLVTNIAKLMDANLSRGQTS